MKIAMITEGNFPYHPGGVSTWCDQMIRGLNEHEFDLHTISCTGRERVTFTLPSNVHSVTSIPIWGPTVLGRTSRMASLANRDPVRRLLVALLAPSGDLGAFAGALRDLFELGQRGELASAVRAATSIDVVLEHEPTFSVDRLRTGASEEMMSVAQATSFVDLLEHWLRPLSTPPPVADICHPVANGLATLVALMSKWAYGTPIVMTEHGVYLREMILANAPGLVDHHARALTLKFFRMVVAVGYDAADIISPCCAYNQPWEEASGATASKIRVVHNGIAMSERPVVPEPDVPSLVYVGRIDPLKDIETLLRGFAIVHDKLPAARLKIYGAAAPGQEEYAAQCRELNSSLGTEGAATFEGHISPPTAAYEASQIVLQTSISEGLPYILLEAMETGRPLIATDVGGVNEAVGSAGLLVPPRNPELLADACISLLVDDELRRSLGDNGRARVHAMFTAERMLDDYRAIYRDVLADDRAVEFERTLVSTGPQAAEVVAA